MQQLPNPKFLFLLIFIGTIAACKKNESLMGSNGFGLIQKSTNANFSQYVSYDASHNVLVFDSFEDVEALFDAIDVYDNNYPMDKGNTSAIFSKYDQIRQYGFTIGNGNGGPNANKVKLQEFQTELLASYPLSDTVLNGLIDLFDELQPSFPPPFMRTVLEANASFTFEVRENIEQCNLPLGIKNQILEKDDNTVIVPNYAYDDFLGSFSGYQSLYKVLETLQKNQLESGMDPANPLFDNDIVSDEQLRLILNTEREIYVKRNLIKLYDSCRYAIFQGTINEAYASLAMLDVDGFLATPTGVIEPATGLTLSTMNSYFPMNYASVNPDFIVRKENPREGAFIELDAIDSYLSFCPQSQILYSLPIANGFEVNFNSITDQNYGSSGTFYQYWTFGDGTGSFQTDPFHVYATPGNYEVTLTTFNQDCGCWDVEKIEVSIGLNAEKGCNAIASWVYNASQSGEVIFTQSYSHDNNASVILIGWDFGDGTTSTNPNGVVSHQYSSTGAFDVVYSVEFSDGCIATYPFTISVGGASCCDRTDRENTNDQTFSYDNRTYKMKMWARANGLVGFWFLGEKLIGRLKFYRQKNNGGWTTQKTTEVRVTFTGFLWTLTGGGNCQASSNVANLNLDTFDAKSSAWYVRHSMAPPNPFGLKNESVVVTFKATIGTESKSYNISLGECD